MTEQTTTVTAAEAADPTSVNAGPDLVLARLVVPSKNPPAPSHVRRDLGKLFERPPSPEQFQGWVDQLRAAGLLTEKGMRLTEAGRERALAYLGATRLPQKYNWGTIQAQYLVPRALGLDPEAQQTREKLKDQKALAALLLRRRFNLPPGTRASLGSTLDALVCRELGFPDQTTLQGVKNAVLTRMVGAPGELKPDDLHKLVSRVLLGATASGVGGLRAVVLRAYAGGAAKAAPAPDLGVPQGGTPPSLADFDLPAFANTVLAVARSCPTGRFGDNKVFISHVWRRLAGEPAFSGMDLDGYKAKLVEAHRADLLTLSRADLVSVMNPEDVRESETPYLNAVFHFILIEKERP